MQNGSTASTNHQHFMNIEIVIGKIVVPAQLLDNPTARDFADMLPLELELADYAQTEKVSDLSRKLKTQGSPDGFKASIGDITYYSPWGNLAIFYRDFPYAAGLILLGRIEGDIGALGQLGKCSVVIRKAKN